MKYKSFGGTNRSYTIVSSPIASGGEGEIYEIEENQEQVLKIFKEEKRTWEKEKKLRTMIGYHLNKEQLKQITWPQDIVYDQSGFAGYIMPKLRSNKNLNMVYSGQIKNVDIRHRIVIAYNLCVAVEMVHNIGQICGDLNPLNISVNLDMNTEDALKVTLVDTDSYHIIDDNITYRCEVGMTNYIAPELQNKIQNGMDLKTALLPTYTKETDLFALAVHIFSLLMNGCHPFSCAKDTTNCTLQEYSVDVPQPIDNIREGFFPFHQQKQGITYPLYALSFSSLPIEIQNMFLQAFEKGYIEPKKRPSTQEWMCVLKKYQTALAFNICHKGHYFFAANSISCPFCETQNRFDQAMKDNKEKEEDIQESQNLQEEEEEWWYEWNKRIREKEWYEWNKRRNEELQYAKLRRKRLLWMIYMIVLLLFLIITFFIWSNDGEAPLEDALPVIFSSEENKKEDEKNKDENTRQTNNNKGIYIIKKAPKTKDDLPENVEVDEYDFYTYEVPDEMVKENGEASNAKPIFHGVTMNKNKSKIEKVVKSVFKKNYYKTTESRNVIYGRIGEYASLYTSFLTTDSWYVEDDVDYILDVSYDTYSNEISQIIIMTKNGNEMDKMIKDFLALWEEDADKSYKEYKKQAGKVKKGDSESFDAGGTSIHYSPDKNEVYCALYAKED